MDRTEQVIRSLKGRLSIHTAQRLMRYAKLPSARSWTELETIIRQSIKSNPDIINIFVNAIAIQAKYDFKSTSYYAINKEVLPVLIETIINIETIESTLALAFPLTVPTEELDKDDGCLKVINSFRDMFGIGLVLSRKRTFTISEEYNRDQFSDSMLDEFPEHEKIIAIKSYHRQTFDIIYLNIETCTLELRADITRSDSLFQTVKQIDTSNKDLKSFANALLYRNIKKQVLTNPHNLFPVIKQIYEDSNGAIKKLGFSTATNSIKHETMKAGIDLREELFHKNGAQAINHQMSLFEISIMWHRKDIDGFDSRPELHIPGTYKNAASLAPRCDFAILKGISDPSDSDFILHKLISFEK
ncbi:hypothetical protein [Azotobacter vinelandii]